MKLTIEIDCSNAAFEPEPGVEVARILTETARAFAEQPEFSVRDEGPIFDLNGNRVGDWKVTR